MRRKSERTKSSDVSSPANTTRRTTRRGRKSPSADVETTTSTMTPTALNDDEQQQKQMIQQSHLDEKVSEKEIEVDNEKPPQNRRDSSSERGDSNDDDDGLPLAALGGGSRSKRKSRTPAKSPSKRGSIKRGRRNTLFTTGNDDISATTTIITTITEENGNQENIEEEEKQIEIKIINKNEDESRSSDLDVKNDDKIMLEQNDNSNHISINPEIDYSSIEENSDITKELIMENIIEESPEKITNVEEEIEKSSIIEKINNVEEIKKNIDFNPKENIEMDVDDETKMNLEKISTENRQNKVSPIKEDKPRRRRFDVRPPEDVQKLEIETKKRSISPPETKKRSISPPKPRNSDTELNNVVDKPTISEIAVNNQGSEKLQSSSSSTTIIGTSSTTTRKRRWLSRKTSETTPVLTISTDSLKNLISDVHPVPLSDVKLDSSPEPEEDVSIVALEEKVIVIEEHEQQKHPANSKFRESNKDRDNSTKIRERSKDNSNKDKDQQHRSSGGSERRIEKDSKSEYHRSITYDRSDKKRNNNNNTSGGNNSNINDEKQSTISTNRKISIINDDEKGKSISVATSGIPAIVTAQLPTQQRPPSPPKNNFSSILYITNLVRPFTVLQLKGLLARTGKIIENGFWIDRIKSKCFVQYENEDEAIETRHALHGVRWPASNPKCLNVDFGSEQAMAKAIASTIEETTPKFGNDSSRDNRIIGTGWDKERFDFDEKKEIQVSRPVREWDVGKKEEFERENIRMRERGDGGDLRRGGERGDMRDRTDRDRNDRGGGGHGGGDRDRDRDRRRHSNERENYKDRRRSNSASPARKQKKKENDPPLRLLDDLFRKTKITPCVYWLPLTPEQIAEKEEIRRKRWEEHEQNRKEREKEREKERDREKEREKERERERRRERSNDRSRKSRSRDRRRY